MAATAPYADIVRVTTSQRHVQLYFAQSGPDSDEYNVVGRASLHPETAGELYAILGAQLALYEEKYGRKVIPADEETDSTDAAEEDHECSSRFNDRSWLSTRRRSG